MFSNLAGQTVVIIGGSSGIGYGVAKAALLEHAAHVIVGSSSKFKVEDALKRLKVDVAKASVEGKITGDVIDAKDSASVKAFFEKIGEIDHLVWTSGDVINFAGQGPEEQKGLFDVRFWGAAVAAKAAQIRKEGSVTLTTGAILFRPRPGVALGSAGAGAVDGFTRGLAVDMAPIRVNCVCPGAVKTELWNTHPPEVQQKLFKMFSEGSLLKHVADPEEIAEAYVFLMKCKYITGQRIEVDGGAKYV